MTHYARLTEIEQAKLRGDLRIFIAERDWEGCGGQEISAEVQVVIAAQACILTLCLESDLYPNVSTILVYPVGYLAPEKTYRPGGVVQETKSHRLGEAWTHGPMVLSWADALAGGRNEADGHNVVFHEFAHKLDMRNGSPDGVPRLLDDEQYARWAQVMSIEFAELVAKSESREADALGQVWRNERRRILRGCTQYSSARKRWPSAIGISMISCAITIGRTRRGGAREVCGRLGMLFVI